MRFSKPTGFVIAAVMLAACNGPSGAGLAGGPSTANTTNVRSLRAHALVAPGRAGRLAVRLGATRPASHRVHHDFAATRPCTYLTDSISADVLVYNKDLSLAGDFASTSYGYGVASTGNGTYIGRNDGTGSLDRYVNCTDHPAGTLAGLNEGGVPYGIANKNKTIYATDWPVGDVEYWPNGGPVQSVVDPNMGLPYTVAVDSAGRVWLVGYDLTFSNEILDECASDFSSCTTQATIAGGFPGGVAVDRNETLYVVDQYGTLYSYDCSSASCVQNGSFVYNNGTNPLDYTGLVLDKYRKHRLWAANIYFCAASYGICGDAQSQSLPLSTAVLGPATPQWDNAEPLGISRWPHG